MSNINDVNSREQLIMGSKSSIFTDKEIDILAEKIANRIPNKGKNTLEHGVVARYADCTVSFGSEKSRDVFVIRDKDANVVKKFVEDDSPERRRVRGYWVVDTGSENSEVCCSVCSKKVYKSSYANQKLKSKFCPNCGSVMDQEET